MSVASPSGRWNLTAIPRPASGSASGVRGWPLAFEKRIVASTGSPCRCAARDSPFASGVAVKVPVADRPLGVDGAVAGVGTAVDRAERVDDLLPHGCGRHDRDPTAVRENRPMPQATLLYDRDCGFCRWCSRQGARLGPARLDLRPVALQSEEAGRLLGGMPEDQRMASWHLVEPGRRGALRRRRLRAELLRLLPGGRPLAALAARAPRRDRARLPLGGAAPQRLGWAGQRACEAPGRRADSRTASPSGRGAQAAART